MLTKLVLLVVCYLTVSVSVVTAAEDSSSVRPLREAIKMVVNDRVTLKDAKIISKGASSLTVSKDGRDYVVVIDSKTVLRRKFGGKSVLGEMREGDSVHVLGKWTDEGKTTIQAKFVRDISIQKRHGVFVGRILSLSDDSLVMSTVSDKRDDQTVMFSDSTKFVDRKDKTLVQEDLAVGQKIRVRGLWNNAGNIVSEVVKIKVYSLPEPTKLEVEQ